MAPEGWCSDPHGSHWAPVPWADRGRLCGSSPGAPVRRPAGQAPCCHLLPLPVLTFPKPPSVLSASLLPVPYFSVTHFPTLTSLSSWCPQDTAFPKSLPARGRRCCFQTRSTSRCHSGRRLSEAPACLWHTEGAARPGSRPPDSVPCELWFPNLTVLAVSSPLGSSVHLGPWAGFRLGCGGASHSHTPCHPSPVLSWAGVGPAVWPAVVGRSSLPEARPPGVSPQGGQSRQPQGERAGQRRSAELSRPRPAKQRGEERGTGIEESRKRGGEEREVGTQGRRGQDPHTPATRPQGPCRTTRGSGWGARPTWSPPPNPCRKAPWDQHGGGDPSTGMWGTEAS